MRLKTGSLQVGNQRHSKHRFQRRSDLLGAPIDDELVLLHVERGQYYSLKGSAPALWERLESPHSAEELVAWVVETYEVDQAEALADIEAFLAELVAIDAVEAISHSES